METVRRHQEGVCWTSTKKKKNREIEKLTNLLAPELNLQRSQISLADHSCRYGQRLKVDNYFRRKAPPQTFMCARNTRLHLI